MIIQCFITSQQDRLVFTFILFTTARTLLSDSPNSWATMEKIARGAANETAVFVKERDLIYTKRV